MKRKSFDDSVCPVARSPEAVGDAWAMLIVRQAFAGDRRFGEFERSLGVAKNILTVRLRKLVGLGVLEQAPIEGSAHHEYVLTEKRGRSRGVPPEKPGRTGACDERSTPPDVTSA